jgi:hypothetical protein
MDPVYLLDLRRYSGTRHPTSEHLNGSPAERGGPPPATVVTATVVWSVPLPARYGCQRITQTTTRRLLP